MFDDATVRDCAVQFVDACDGVANADPANMTAAVSFHHASWHDLRVATGRPCLQCEGECGGFVISAMADLTAPVGSQAPVTPLMSSDGG